MIPHRIKKWTNLFILFGLVIVGYGIINVYFNTKDNLFINPFGFKTTKISIKSLYIQSTSNIALFMLKPFGSSFFQFIIAKYHACRYPSSISNNKTLTQLKSNDNTYTNYEYKREHHHCRLFYKKPVVCFSYVCYCKCWAFCLCLLVELVVLAVSRDHWYNQPFGNILDS